MFLLLKNILFTVLVPGTVAVYLPLRVVTRPPAALAFDWRASQVGALLPLLLGAAVYFWCLWDFAMTGRGTPAPIDAPQRLVARGLYRYIRNPMYVGVLLVIAGWAVFLQSWRVLIYATAVGIFFHLFVVLVEERLLEGKFGETYVRYCGEVGRWLPRRWR
ncbi:MAG TPA: isoprenylcysteine carboxylmethyltransferase family protein [Blastocatellia bacterium]|nr:isoprenylcysteine carboxylmethyltransferase family protein [Blastocatellia bacterium]